MKENTILVACLKKNNKLYINKRVRKIDYSVFLAIIEMTDIHQDTVIQFKDKTFENHEAYKNWRKEHITERGTLR